MCPAPHLRIAGAPFASRPEDGGERRVFSTLRDLWPVLAAGMILRVLWLVDSTGGFSAPEAGEASRVALSVAAGRGIADAFPGLGATAHLMPVMPVIAGSILWLFGAAAPRTDCWGHGA